MWKIRGPSVVTSSLTAPSAATVPSALPWRPTAAARNPPPDGVGAALLDEATGVGVVSPLPPSKPAGTMKRKTAAAATAATTRTMMTMSSAGPGALRRRRRGRHGLRGRDLGAAAGAEPRVVVGAAARRAVPGHCLPPGALSRGLSAPSYLLRPARHRGGPGHLARQRPGRGGGGRRAGPGYAARSRRTLPWPRSIRAAAARAAAAPNANVAHGPTELHSSPPTVLAAKLASPVAV